MGDNNYTLFVIFQYFINMMKTSKYRMVKYPMQYVKGMHMHTGTFPALELNK